MKKILILTMSLALFLSGGLLVLAEEAASETLPTPRILPGSIIYPLKLWSENIRSIFSFGLEARLKRAQELALMRLAEIKALAEKEKTDRLDLAAEYYQRQQDRVRQLIDRGGNLKEDLIERVAESTSRHLNVLEEIRGRSPEEAERGLSWAIVSAERLRQAAQRMLGPDNQEFSASERPVEQPIQERIRRSIQLQLEKIRGVFDQK